MKKVTAVPQSTMQLPPLGEQTLRALVHGSPLAIFAVDRAARILFWNQAAERLFGWQAEEVLGRTNPIVPVERDAEFRLLRERAVAGEVYRGMDLTVRCKDGASAAISISTAPLKALQDGVDGVMVMAVDISERQAMLEMLQQSLDKSQRLFRQTIQTLATALEIRDPYTAGHQQRVARLAQAIAE